MQKETSRIRNFERDSRISCLVESTMLTLVFSFISFFFRFSGKILGDHFNHSDAYLTFVDFNVLFWLKQFDFLEYLYIFLFLDYFVCGDHCIIRVWTPPESDGRIMFGRRHKQERDLAFISDDCDSKDNQVQHPPPQRRKKKEKKNYFYHYYCSFLKYG